MGKLKDYFKREHNYEVPTTLAVKFRKYQFLSLITFVLGIFACLFAFDGVDSLKAMLFPIALSLFVYIDGYLYITKVEKEGFDEYEGVCIDHKVTNPGTMLAGALTDADFTLRKQVVGLIFECENDLYLIPIPKKTDVVPIGCKMKVYVPKDVISRKTDTGLTIFGSIFGYELLADPDDENP